MIFRALTAACLLTACTAKSEQLQNVPDKAMMAGIERGADTYRTLCATCHGDNMQGGMGSSLIDGVWALGSEDADILKVIEVGVEEAGMPAFSSTLSEAELAELLTFIRSGQALTTTPAVDGVPSLAPKVKTEDWVTGLDEPWGFVFTGADDAIVTEKSGALRFVENGQLVSAPVRDIPSVTDNGQGGLLDVALDPDFSDSGWIYLAFSDPAAAGKAMTKIVRGRIVDGRWVDEQTLFQAQPGHYVKSHVHFGSRITFDDEGYLFFSIGDRGQKDQAQDVNRPNGKIHRIHRDGSIPEDNPFVDRDGAYKSIYAYGNRNPQGLIVHPQTQVLWETEHGPRGGDELNAIRAGVNYGWPEISYGRNYSGTELTPHTALPGMAQPASHWTPSIAVCGLDVYTGDLFPEWQGRLLAGSLRNESLRLISVEGESYISEDIILENQGRIRDVTTGPDGAIYVALPDRIVRLTPKE